ncbi:carnosine N-methyltransferase isoform X2 [Eutrema salsugineum]|uniref:carnosine N-methyltransferase isoform X2 n=1 Tax=Eutrema salsugineum TaxID=72664 RepID=UPI000CED756C|nr:carnosine N-methyltransferase isoform X2 [Eutrema salsugineum]
MISSSEMTATATAPAPAPAPDMVSAIATGTERKEMLREVDDEKEEKIRRQKKLEEALEAKSLRRIISAYLNYPEASEEDLKRWERSYRKLSPGHKALVPHYPLKFQRLRRCISTNSYFIFNMLQAFEPPIDLSQDLDGFEDPNLECAPNEKYILDERHDSSCQPALTSNCTYQQECKSLRDPVTGTLSIERKDANDHSPKNHSEDTRINDKRNDCDGGHSNHDHGNASFPSHDWLDPSLQTHVPLVDVDKVRCIIRNIVRDWAAEGQRERDQCYKPILEELDSLFPNRQKESTPPACLVPGAGLGRLALEISCLGFISQGNEFSYYMMICSSFILNYLIFFISTQVPGEWTIYPWIHSNCNSLSDNDQLRPISIPDIHPASAGITEGFSMCGGDFVEVYNESGHEGMWDAVVTCFFIDTAHNIIEYIETISKILKDGGVWINLGPLLYHFADTYGHENEMSIELSLEDVKKVASHHGFEIEKERTIETTYTTNPRSMMQNRYYAAFWTMRKKCATKT